MVSGIPRSLPAAGRCLHTLLSTLNSLAQGRGFSPRGPLLYNLDILVCSLPPPPIFSLFLFFSSASPPPLSVHAHLSPFPPVRQRRAASNKPTFVYYNLVLPLAHSVVSVRRDVGFLYWGLGMKREPSERLNSLLWKQPRITALRPLGSNLILP